MSAILEDIVAEGERLLSIANDQGVPLHLLGGVAVRLHAPEVPAALQVCRDRAPQPPLRGTQLCDARAVDAVVVVIAHVVSMEEEHRVANVLLVDLDDLQLGEQ